MVPAWHRTSIKDKTVFLPCWLLSTSPHGSIEGHVLIAFDDQPHPSWNYPAGSLVVRSVRLDDIRLRRTEIPLMEKRDGDQ